MTRLGAAAARACALVLALLGCDPVSGDLPGAVTTTLEATPADGGAASSTDATAPSSAAPDCTTTAGPSRREQVCHRWRCDDAAAKAPATWSGSSATCDAGAVDAAAGARTLALVNLHRFLADLPPVALEPKWNDAAEQCALMAHANEALSHAPGRDWRCFTDLGALASQVSLIANRSAPPAIEAFVEDPGNASTMVHRRWLLNDGLTAIGIGSTDRYSCVVVAGSALDRARGDISSHPPATEPRAPGWVAWPPAGPIPIDVFTTERLDAMGWTVQADAALDDAVASVSSSGQILPVAVTHLERLEGSTSAIAFAPQGWTTEAGKTYDVVVRGASRSGAIAFSVEPVACP
jgi:uncharacterized protein YkwD